ncbi:MAG: hypothetical protein FWB96_00710 [Defluviitaleaceae bacterium]|nr:hypothetical protein [Defluviitaleaceae bacterium]MCL2262730.1 hypothetical protein [Defluviitaleaceae bacterium]
MATIVYDDRYNDILFFCVIFAVVIIVIAAYMINKYKKIIESIVENIVTAIKACLFGVLCIYILVAFIAFCRISYNFLYSFLFRETLNFSHVLSLVLSILLVNVMIIIISLIVRGQETGTYVESIGEYDQASGIYSESYCDTGIRRSCGMPVALIIIPIIPIISISYSIFYNVLDLSFPLPLILSVIAPILLTPIVIFIYFWADT